MHGGLLLVTVLVACWLRCHWQWCSDRLSWAQRWQRALLAFCLPPLMLISAAIAILVMGHHGPMLGMPVVPYSCWLAAALLSSAVVTLLMVSFQSYRSWQQLLRYEVLSVASHRARLVPTPAAFAAQIGGWQPQLVVSQGLLDHLSPPQVAAVIAHEQAHVHFRDTFWFFWLGWLRWFSGWLPQTEALWQELLLLREMRADRWATGQVDALLLAEVLVKLVALPLGEQSELVAALSHGQSSSRLEQRIAALVTPEPAAPQVTVSPSLLWGLMPLVSVLLHS